MKATLIIFILAVIVACSAYSQHPIYKKYVMQPQLLHQQVSFKVTNHAKDTLARVSDVASFHLAPEEKKAVTRTGRFITRLDQSVLPKMKDTAIHARVFMLPELYYAKVKGTEQQVSFRILFIDSAPLKYDFEKQLFSGSIRFLPVEVSDSANTQPSGKPLSTAEDILVSFGSTSFPLSITEINWPPRDITITDPDPIDSVEVKIITVTNPTGYAKNLAVEPAIILSSTRTIFQGFGIQTLTVDVALKGVSKHSPIPVMIESSLGTVDSSSLILTGDKPHHVILRSEGIGKINLKAVNPNYRCNSISIEAVFPWLFLLLAMLGGLIGGLGKNLLGNENVTFRALLLGCIIGLIAAFAYWGLGITLIGFSLETRGLNESMVFGLGLVAGYFGLIGLKK